MTVDLPSYPSYRPSGLSWLDRVPTHWEIKRNGQLFSQRKETGFAELPILEVSLRTGVRVRRFDSAARKQIMSDRSKYKRAAKGDVAYNMMRMWQGSVGVAPEGGLVSPAYVVASPFTGVNPGYFSELFRTAAYMGEVDAHSHGIVKDRNRLYWEDFKQIFSICPPFAEQQAIVRFINHVDRLTVRYIQAKRHLISLFGEERQVIVDHAFGYGSEAVPKRWQETRLKYVATVQTGLTLGKDYGSQELVEHPYLRVANVQAGSLNLRDMATVRVPKAEAMTTVLQDGDVLMTEGGDIDKLGRGCVWHGEIEDCLHQNHIFAVRPEKSVLLPDYLAAMLASSHGRRYFETTAKKTTNLASTNSTTLGRFPLLLPEIGEQHEILGAVATRTSALDLAMQCAKHEIDLLREYRTRLITDIVTGQLDVRDAASKLPDEGGEQDKMSLADDILEEVDEADLGMDDTVEEVAG